MPARRPGIANTSGTTSWVGPISRWYSSQAVARNRTSPGSWTASIGAVPVGRRLGDREAARRRPARRGSPRPGRGARTAPAAPTPRSRARGRGGGGDRRRRPATVLIDVRRARAAPRGTARGTSPAAACPTTSSAASTGCTSITSRGGRPHTSSVRWWMAWRTVVERRRPRVGLSYLGDDDDALLALVALHAEGDDVAGAHAVDVPDGALDVLREHVAAADDDDVLDPPAQHELAVDHVGEVAGAQPAVVEQLGRGVGPLVVARRHRRAADQQLADVALGPLVERLGVDDAHLEARAPACRAAAGGGPSSAKSSGSATSTGLATRSRSSTMRSTVSHTRPRPRGGNEPPIATSAMPNAGNTPPAGKPNGAAAATNASTASGSTGSAPDSASVSVDRSRSLHPLERAGGEDPREVRAGGRRAAEVGDPLHPVAGPGHEVLRRGLHERARRSSSGSPGSRRGPCRGTAAATRRAPRARARCRRPRSRRRRSPTARGRGSSRPSARSSTRSCTAG